MMVYSSESHLPYNRSFIYLLLVVGTMRGSYKEKDKPEIKTAIMPNEEISIIFFLKKKKKRRKIWFRFRKKGSLEFLTKYNNKKKREG